MSYYKRAEWHSGLTYRQTCEQCKAVVEYTDLVLDFRPWYADGFVYCPRCNTPLRHDEKYDISRPVVIAQPKTAVARFCTECGQAFRENDRFCSQCGAKR